jgi:hypothetical protein
MILALPIELLCRWRFHSRDGRFFMARPGAACVHVIRYPSDVGQASLQQVLHGFAISRWMILWKRVQTLEGQQGSSLIVFGPGKEGWTTEQQQHLEEFGNLQM